MMQRFDVAIIGAGPAGSAAAISLARRGYSVALFDKQQFPREKICGDFLTPANWSIYRELEVESAILREPHAKITTVRITAPSGAQAVSPISQGDGRHFALGMSRHNLDWVLLQAAARQGVVVRQKRRVRNLIRQAVDWRIDTEHEQDIESVRAKVLIGADGRNSKVAHQLGLAGKSEKAHDAVGYQFRLRGVESGSDRIDIHIFPGGYAGLAHLGDGTANLCLSTTRALVAGLQPAARMSSLGLGRNPFLRKILSSSEISAEARSTFPVYFPPRRSYAERVLLVGDAARVVEPVTGEGVYLAGRSGLIAAQMIDEAFRRGDFSSRRLSLYQKRCRRELRRRHALNRLMQFLVYRPSLGEALIRFSAGRQRLLNSMVRAICAPEQVEISAGIPPSDPGQLGR